MPSPSRTQDLIEQSIRGRLPLTTGKIFYVHSGTGTNSPGNGLKPTAPFASVVYALTFCTASKGDIIALMPGHAETYTADAAWNVAGVAIVGLGWGALRPTFTVGDATTEEVQISAASMWVENCVFISGIDQQANIVRVLAADCTIKACEFREATSIQPLTCLDITGASANDCDRTKVIDCIFRCPTAGDADRGIELGEVADGVEIRGCIMFGDWDDACIHNVTGKVMTNLIIADCLLNNKLTGQHSIELVSACTGYLVRNLYINDLTQATGSDPGSCGSFECYHTDTVDVSGILSPAVT